MLKRPTAITWNFDDPVSGSENTSTLANPIHVFPAHNGTYSVRATVSNPCFADTLRIPVLISSYPQLTVDPEVSICKNESVTIIAAGAKTYSWSNGVQDSAVTLSPPQTNTYTVFGSSINGCTTSKTVTIAVNPSLGFFDEPRIIAGFFPVPVSQFLTVNASKRGLLFINDIYRRAVLIGELQQGTNQLDLTTLYSGVYFLTAVPSRVDQHPIN